MNVGLYCWGSLVPCIDGCLHFPNHIEMLHTKFEVSRSSLCFSAADLLQKCCRAAADLLQIMKAHYLEMLHAKFEVCKSNSMVVRELKVTLQKLVPPPPPPPPPPPVTPSLV